MKGHINIGGNYVVEFEGDDLLFFSKVMEDYGDLMEKAEKVEEGFVSEKALNRYHHLLNVFRKEATKAQKEYLKTKKGE